MSSKKLWIVGIAFFGVIGLALYVSSSRNPDGGALSSIDKGRAPASSALKPISPYQRQKLQKQGRASFQPKPSVAGKQVGSYSADRLRRAMGDQAANEKQRRKSWSRLDRRLARAELLGEDKGRPDADGKFEKVSVYRSDFKYPLIRVEESYRQDAPGGAEMLTAKTAMIADHLVVSLNQGASLSDLEKVAQLHGAKVRRSVPRSNMYLVEFDGTQPEAYERVRDALEGESIVQSTDPDYLISVPGARR